uniref:Prepronociceptin b n=1 Tax=Echeneis naucrates TaxID=173247 RepID=A0A665WC35_ECHNA
MKIPLWCLLVLLACLFTPGRSDCQGECVACGLLMQQQQQLQQAFNTMVCLLECEGRVSSSLTWEVCKSAVKLSHHPMFPDGGALLKRTGGELELTSLDLNSDSELLQPAAAQPVQERDRDETPLKQRIVQYESLVDEEMEPREERDVENDGQLGVDEDDTSESVSLSKRFGGFQRGRHGYRKLIGSPMRPLQKRYGGFIGVRKSARKWNNQKRVNQLLRQYLGMRSSFSDLRECDILKIK